MTISPGGYVSRIQLRSLLQQALNDNPAMSQQQLEAWLTKKTGQRFTYFQVNGALNSPAGVNETPFARHLENGVWLWYAVTPENPLTQVDANAKLKAARTMLRKATIQLIAPAVRMNAVAKGDGDALDETLGFMRIVLQQLDLAMTAGARKAEMLQAQAAARAAEQSATVRGENLAKMERELERELLAVRRQKAANALTIAQAPKVGPKKVIRKRK